eukprot:TRINITY_DN7718_c0_g1_i1.p1 TRINITY_DN7718_c0_g1~~TRINITY_DN7718_c0_g1_i1.p1  ORF type:complete len:143 (+),score=25.65 TRINITY_DN7718_c0_g1_i1:85-513(+)
MILWNKPSENWLNEFLHEQKSVPLSYPEVNSTWGRGVENLEHLRPKYDLDCSRIKLGTGKQCFDAAIQALHQWKMHEDTWIEIFFRDTPIQEGNTIGILVSQLGFYTLNVCKILYIVDETDSSQKKMRYGFAYGTTPTHVER